MPNRWWSENPEKARTEKFFLIYSPVWMASMAMMMLTGWDKQWSDAALLVHAALTALPVLLVPLLLAPKLPGIDWYETYGFKVNWYLFVFGFFGNYFGSEYFFDVLGMVYIYPNVSTNLDSALLGSGEQKVPLIMYFYTHVYFMTYHTTANIALRKIAQHWQQAKWAIYPTAVFVIGYAWAWMETKAMANPMMVESFYYQKMDIMLAYGSAIYATYFIASFPIYAALDEKAGQRWTFLQVSAAALSASMLTFYMLDLCARWVGSI